MVVSDSGSLSAYWRFHRAVADAQLSAWLSAQGSAPGSAHGPAQGPAQRQLLIDISGPHARCAELATAAGHTVLRVPDADLSSLADGSADGVMAEDRTLSMHLAAETVAAEIARVLKPEGRVLAAVDSLVLGMAVLAEQHHWAELSDLPQAEVVLVPWPDGMLTRCFGAEQLRELCTDAGLNVSWIRPRTALSPSTVTHLLRRAPATLPRLVAAELAARTDESVGFQLVVSACKKTRGRP
jgi:hypothetical protein